VGSKTWFIIIICILLASGSGCLGRSDSQESLLRVSSLSNPLTLNPLFVRDATSAEAVSLLYPELIGFDRDTLLPVPRIISGWQISDDGLTYHFTLRNDVSWSDGSPLTAEDVAFTLRIICHRDYTGSLYMHMRHIAGAQEYRESHTTPFADGSISGVRVVDEYTLEITLNKRLAPFLTYMSIAPLPAKVLDEVNVAEMEGHSYSRTVPVGAGPYLLVEWVPDFYIHVRANEKYFLGKPKIENLYYCIMPNQETQLIELLAGRLDLLPTSVKVEDIDQLKNDPSLAVYTHLRLAYDYLGFNMNRKNSPLTDKNVRQALSMILDRYDIVDNLLLGHGIAATGPLSPLQFAYNKELKGHSHDLLRAKEILHETPYPSFELEVIYSTGNLVRENAALLFQERAASLGVTVRLSLLEWEAFLNALYKGEYDMILLGHGTGVDPDLTYYWHSESPGNYLGYSNKEVDRLLEEGIVTLGMEERTRIYQQAEQLIVDDAPVIWLFFREAVHVATNRLKNFNPHPVSLFYNVHEWSLEK
jgi:peptide/nickel transport system substrate-binding protein